MKKYAAMLLSIVLLLGLFMPQAAAAEESAKATTLRMTATEGTVTLKNANGRSLTIREDMKLYSGYTIQTGVSSYAYISLDDTKAIKLDASTTAEVRKSGKKLEVLVSAGKIFFNVTAPLKEDEKLEIRTSTIVTGIRGTSGIIDYVDETTSSLCLLDGSVIMQAVDPETGASVQVPVQAGQVAVANKVTTSAPVPVQTPPQPGTSPEPDASAAPSKTPDVANVPGVTIKPLGVNDVPGFVATEIAKNTELQQKIAEQSKINVDQVVKKAAETLVQEQKKAEKEAKQVEQALAKEENKVASAAASNDTPKKAPSDGGGSWYEPGPNPVPKPTVTPTPSVTPKPDVVELSGPVEGEELVKRFRENDIVVIQPSGDVTITGEFEIPEKKELVVSGADGQQNYEVNLTADSYLKVLGTLNVSSDGFFSNTGRLEVRGGALEITAKLDNSGELLISSGLTLDSGASLNNKETGVLRLEDSHDTNLTVLAKSGSQMSNDGICYLTMEQAGSIWESEAAFQIGDTGAVIAKGPIELLDTLNLSGVYTGVQGNDEQGCSGIWWKDFSKVSLNETDMKSYINDILGRKNSKIYLSSAQTATEFPYNLEVKKEEDGAVTIDLNGGTLTMGAGKTITNQGNLVICDSSEEKTGVLDLGDGQLKNMGMLEVTGATVTSGNGTVTLNNGKPGNSVTSAVITLTGGTITNASVAGNGATVQNFATLYVSGGTISAASQRETVANSGVMTVTDGLVQNTGTGMAVQNAAELSIEGGTVSSSSQVATIENSSASAWNPQVGTLRISSGEIRCNGDGLGSVSGAAVKTAGDVELSGGTVSGSTGILISGNSAHVTVSGGTVAGELFGINMESDVHDYSVLISDGTVKATQTVQNSYAINGPFQLSGNGLVWAKGSNDTAEYNYGVCAQLPNGYVVVEESTEGYYYLRAVNGANQ